MENTRSTLHRTRWLLALLAAFALLVAACGDDTDTDAGTDGDNADDPGDTGDTGDAALPGEGVEVTMARADWQSGYIQAEIYHQIVAELGYDVPDDVERAVDQALPAGPHIICTFGPLS